MAVCSGKFIHVQKINIPVEVEYSSDNSGLISNVLCMYRESEGEGHRQLGFLGGFPRPILQQEGTSKLWSEGIEPL